MSAQETSGEVVGFRLSPQQEHLLEAQADRPAVQCAVALDGPAREADLRNALDAAVSRYEILRTTFPRTPGLRSRSQLIHDSMAFEWTECDDPSLGDPGALQGVLEAEAARSFDLDRGPLGRALLIQAGEDRAVLVLTVHGACADAGSLLIVLRQVVHGRAGESAEPVQYADYAQWRHELVSSEDEAAVEGGSFWRAGTDELPSAAAILFAPRGDSAVPSHGAWRSLPIAIESEPLTRAAERSGVGAPVYLEAAWHALLARTCGASEMMLAGWCDGRAQPDLEDAVGPLAQVVPIRSRIERGTTFAEVLDQVERARAQGVAWQDYARAEDLAGVVGEATAAFAAFDIGALPEALELAALTPPAALSPLLHVRSSSIEPRAELWFDPAGLSGEDAAQLASGLQAMLRNAAEDPARPVADLSITDGAERDLLLTQAAGPPPCADAATPVHELFERQVELTPEAPAVADADGQLSYRELSAATNRLAGLLRELGVAPGANVGICMERTTKLLTAVLAVLKAGGAYVPLNHEHPPARLSHQLTEARAAVLITEEHLRSRLPEIANEVVCVDADADAERIALQPDRGVKSRSSLGDLAYVMYTSGSTGLPKGVAVSHGNLANYATSIVKLLGAGEQAWRFGVVSAISTDLGNTCIFPPLICGGCVQLISPGASMDAAAIRDELSGATLDVLKVTPSHLRALISGDSAEAVPTRWLLLGGEALSWDLLEKLDALGASARIVNHYGPTETTVGCCVHVVGEHRTDCATVPIGRALAGVRAYVLGAGDDMLPPGVPGELCIAGAGVATGYVGRADGDDGPFGDDPLGSGRMYRTGDLARYLRDGAIEFLGRVDEQVKIRGFRIEPGEIEATLLRHPAVRQAAVAAERDDRDELRLVGYVATSAAPAVDELQDFLARSLPEYMVPSAFAMLPSLPFTASGKVDRRALREIATAQTRRQAEYVAPRDEVESQIAAIWSELLGVERVGVFDEFFALGGHSLLATQAIMRIRREHGNIPLGALLAAPTVADLAEVIRGAAS